MFAPSRIGLVMSTIASLVAAGPCDLYAAGDTPCVAAHSTTRALFDSYSGPLYQVRRTSDGTTRNIKPMVAGGVAKSKVQDSFCSGTTCVITIIFDQSSRRNDLTPAPPGGAASGEGVNGFDLPADAFAAPVYLDGQKVYGVYISPGMGYRDDETDGMPTADEPQGIYGIFDGTHYNDACCFDYGNAETNNDDNGNGHMSTINISNSTGSGGSGDGPWILADFENGLFSGQERGVNPANPSINYRFITAIVKGRPNHWSIRGGDATSGNLETFYNGPRPNAEGYNPMSKEGAIILGIGGDNSNGGRGTFYEGAITSGYPSNRAERNVQANIVAARYTV